jgi:hypothetical protein
MAGKFHDAVFQQLLRTCLNLPDLKHHTMSLNLSMLMLCSW